MNARAFSLDVTDPEHFARFADSAFAALGDVPLVVNNAGVGQQRGSVVDIAETETQRVMAVNFHGVWRGCQLFGRRLIEQGTFAAIYNTGSENSFFIAEPFCSLCG